MGCYNTIYFNCPYCNNRMEEQSKSGTCNLLTYSIYTAPIDDLGILDSATYTCDKCKKTFSIKLSARVDFILE